MRDFHSPGRSPVFASNGMCAASHPFAAREAVKLMEDGGNAMDAAIAAAALLGLTEPSSTGIGGDMFALIRPAGEIRILGFNASGCAPAALHAEQLREAGATEVDRDHAHSVTMPGAIDGFCRLAEDWGRLGLAASLAPSIRYADEGAPVGLRTAMDWAAYVGRLRGDAAKHYSKNGAPYAAGEVFRAPGQAEILRRVARDGRAAFYEGEVMQDMLDSLRALGGLHTAEDFASVACEYVDPISAHYKGLELVELPPNGQGATALLLANILSRFDLASLDPFGAERAHLEAEASKLAYDARNRLIGDPEGAAHAVARMLSDDVADRLAGLIDPNRAAPTPPPAAGTAHRDTVNLTVVDRDGMVVSMIYSVYLPFGSGLASARFGVNFHNRGGGFTLQAGHPNELRGGRRPMHTIIPAMLRQDGEVVGGYGVMGGQYQATGHVRMLTNMLDYGMDPQSAIDGARVFADPEDGKLHIERGYAESVRAELAAKGHDLLIPTAPIGGAQMVRINPSGVLEGASDPRKDGCALGY